MVSHLLPVVALAAAAQSAAGLQPTNGVTEADFWKHSQALMRDPFTMNKAKSRVVLLFATQSRDVAVVLTKDETALLGKSARYRSLLMTAYFVGNIQAQLRTGVKRNDRYAGYLHLLQLHRAIMKKDSNYKNAPLDDLLKLHREGKLLTHVVALEKKNPTDIEKLRRRTGAP